MTVNIKILKEHPDVRTPAKAHPDDAGFDLHAWLPTTDGLELAPGERTLVPTGLRFGIPAGYEIQIRPRSGLALKKGISVVNSPGTIDAGYVGPVGIILINHSNEVFRIEHDDRICQAVVAVIPTATLEVVDALDESLRGEGGYGSTGTK